MTGSVAERRPWAVLLGTIAIVVVAVGLLGWLTTDPGARSSLEAALRSPVGLAVLFGLAALSSATLILPAPALALTALAGAAGNPLVVGVVAGLGQAVGELTGYLAGRSGKALLPATPQATRLGELVRRHGAIVIFVLAVIPNPLFDLAGIAAGAAGMPIPRYLAAAAAGKVLKNVIVAVGAGSIGDLFAMA